MDVNMSRTANVQIDDEQPVLCEVPEGLAVHHGDMCVFEVNGVLDVGRVVDLSEGGVVPVAASQKPTRVIRCATLQDQAKADETALKSRMAMNACIDRAQKHKLDMRIIKTRYSFDRKVLMIVFASEERIDFREMVKELASEMHARIDMKQIGVRDETGMIGGIGPCGRNLCCCSWLHEFESINVKMAKTQRLSLNPAAISGMCGRLKCCLKYEYDQYLEADRKLPRDGEAVMTPEGRGCVCSKDILAARVKVRMDDHRILNYDVKDLEKDRG